MARLVPALLALTLAAAAGGPIHAQQPAVTPAPVPAPEPVVLPKAPIPYSQLTKRAAASPDGTAQTAATATEPLKRVRGSSAILQALDKVTAESLRFEAPIGKPIRYKSLVFTVRACETSAPDEAMPESAAYVIIDSEPRLREGRAPLPARQIFRGWMYASTPGVNPVQHPVYDAWLIACKTAAPSPVNR